MLSARNINGLGGLDNYRETFRGRHEIGGDFGSPRSAIQTGRNADEYGEQVPRECARPGEAFIFG